MKSMRLLQAVGAAVILASCATPYQKNFVGGGYSDKQLSESEYVVSFNGNGYASKERVWYFWIYRCAELTTEKGYSYFTLSPNKKTASAAQTDGALLPAVYRPDERAGSLVKVKGSSAPIYIYTPGYSITTWSSNAKVQMFHEQMPVDQLWAFSAKSVLDQLKPYVSSNGESLPPSRKELLKLAFRTRDHIVIGDHIKVTGTGLFTDNTAPEGYQPRSAASLRNAMDATALLMFQAVYSEHASRTLDAFGGDVILSFVVSPGGIVKNPGVVSSTIADRRFLEALVEVMRETNFGGADAVETRVTEFPILFAPRT